ncbi:DUF5685 family protein [Nocardia thailandica]
MFGVLRPCAHGAEKYGIDPGRWQAHMCGLCLGLRDGHGQFARAATNTDAVVLSILTEAQLGAGSRGTAGPCALRGLRRAQVATADSPGVRLAATASLLLGAAKIRDHIDDGDTNRLARRPLRGVSDRWAARARAEAAAIDLDVDPLLAAIATQHELEARAARGDATDPITLDELTGPTRTCTGALFGHTARLAGRPENITHLTVIGREVGRIAHLADAIEDFERDTARGRFNPLAATGTGMPRAYDLVRESESRIRAAAAEAGIDRVPAVRWALLDPLAGLLHRLARGLGLAVRHACRTKAEAPQAHTPYQFPTPPQHRPPRRPGPLKATGLILGVYCTGVACCVDHTSPCSGEQKDAWIKNCDCDSCCEGCDCCSGCGDCGDGCDCCSCDCSC